MQKDFRQTYTEVDLGSAFKLLISSFNNFPNSDGRTVLVNTRSTWGYNPMAEPMTIFPNKLQTGLLSNFFRSVKIHMSKSSDETSLICKCPLYPAFTCFLALKNLTWVPH